MGPLQIKTEWHKLSGDARNALRLAEEAATRQGDGCLNTAHLLLGLLRHPAGLARMIFKNMGLLGLEQELEKGRLEVLRSLELAQMMRPGRRPFQPMARMMSVDAIDAVTFAVHEANALLAPHVGMAHLLLGLLRKPDTIAAQTIVGMGVRLETVREEIMRVIHPLTPPRHDPPAFRETTEKAIAELIARVEVLEGKAAPAPKPVHFTINGKQHETTRRDLSYWAILDAARWAPPFGCWPNVTFTDGICGGAVLPGETLIVRPGMAITVE